MRDGLRAIHAVLRPGAFALLALLFAATLVACSSSNDAATTATPAASTGAGAAGQGNGNGSGSGTGGGNGGGGGTGGGAGRNASTPPAGTIVVTITRGGETVKAWTLDQLQADVPFRELTIDGDVQNGPLLLDVLNTAGITDWTTAEVVGKGPSRAFDVSVTVEAAKVNDGWILDITRQGSVKLASTDLPREQWVRDISEIQVQ